MIPVLDADKQMHTAKALAEAEPAIRVGTLFEANLIPKTVWQLAKEHDDVVADAPARLDDEARALMVVANVVIFPMEPTIKSLRSTKSSIEVLEYAREITGGNPSEAWIVINKAKKRTRILKEIEEAAANLGLVVAKTVIRDLQAFPEADQRGTVVTRLSNESVSNTKAKNDIESLFTELIDTKQRAAANE
jgi:cellulose biosynthesis protein BcsQ